MAKGRNSYISDPLGGGGKLGTMESGLIISADSLMGSPRSSNETVLHFGAPGNPLEKSSGVNANTYGKVPNIQQKFIRKGQA